MVKFDAKAFKQLYFTVQARHQAIERLLQVTGQAGFYLRSDDLQDLRVSNGLARFLGVEKGLEKFSGKFKKQNPEPLADKVRNFAQLEKTVNEIDRYDLDTLPTFEPDRTALVPSYVTCESAPLLYMPVQASVDREVKAWMAAIDGVPVEALGSGLNQKDLRRWKRQHPGHRTFTVLRHPARRAHAAFCRHFLAGGDETYHEIRAALGEIYGIDLPGDMPPGKDWDRVRHRTAFLGFLKFVAGNLAGQTGIRVDGSWASQGKVVTGFGQVRPPDRVLRGEGLAAGLAALSREVGLTDPPPVPAIAPDTPFSLDDIYDDAVEEAVRKAYQRDFMLFGYRPWSKTKR